MRNFILNNRRYLLAGLLLFLVFIYMRFPVSRYRSNLEEMIEQQLPGSKVTIGEMSTTLLPGVLLNDVRIIANQTQSTYTIQRIKLRLHPMSFLLRKLNIGFKVTSSAIKLSGHLSNGVLGRDYAALDVDIQSLNLNQLFAEGYLKENLVGRMKQNMAEANPMMGGMLAGVALQGDMAGSFSIAGGKKEVSSFSLADVASNLVLKGSKIFVEGLIPGGLDLGTLEVRFNVDESKGELSTLSIKGKDLSVSGKGDMKFEKPPKQGTINLEVQLNIPDTARQNLAGSLNMALIPMGVEIKNGRAGFRVNGQLGGRTPPRLTPIN